MEHKKKIVEATYRYNFGGGNDCHFRGIYEILKRCARLLHSQIYNGEGLNAGRSRTGRHHRDRIDPARRTVSSATTNESQQEYKTSEQHRHPWLEALALSFTASRSTLSGSDITRGVVLHSSGRSRHIHPEGARSAGRYAGSRQAHRTGSRRACDRSAAASSCESVG